MTNLGIAWDFEYDSRPQDAGYDMGAFEMPSSTLIKALPVELIAFDSYCNHDGAHLTWTTASEVNNSHFTVYKSLDASSWQFVKEVPGFGNSSILRNYNSVIKKDKALVTWYYKVDQTDFDGKTTTLMNDVITCEGDVESCMTVGPNPSTNPNVNIKLDDCFYNKEVTIRVVDAVGREVYSNTVVWENHEAMTIHLNDVSTKGIYFVMASTKQTHITEKLIIQ